MVWRVCTNLYASVTLTRQFNQTFGNIETGEISCIIHSTRHKVVLETNVNNGEGFKIDHQISITWFKKLTPALYTRITLNRELFNLFTITGKGRELNWKIHFTEYKTVFKKRFYKSTFPCNMAQLIVHWFHTFNTSTQELCIQSFKVKHGKPQIQFNFEGILWYPKLQWEIFQNWSTSNYNVIWFVHVCYKKR